jgi:8-oxo-dGTP diphosphatase/2-hydroxy-dATP diphosphatase
MKRLTLCLIHQPPRMLLGMKKRGHGEGRWNGFGGKVHEGETMEQAAQRELQEEVGITAASLNHVGTLVFEYPSDPEPMEVHVFHVDTFTGEPMESDEMRPQWFRTDTLPFEHMWPDDRFWMPLFLAGKKFKGRCVFDAENQIVEHDIHEVESL